MIRFYKMGTYSYDKERFLRIQRQSCELIIPLAYRDMLWIKLVSLKSESLITVSL